MRRGPALAVIAVVGVVLVAALFAAVRLGDRPLVLALRPLASQQPSTGDPAPEGTPPPLIEGRDLAALFGEPPKGPLQTSNGAATLAVIDAPPLHLPGGRLVGGDVFFLPVRSPFLGALPRGETAATLLRSSYPDGDQRMAAVLIGDRRKIGGLEWTIIAAEGAPSLPPGQVPAFAVDSGTAGFTSAEAVALVRNAPGYDDRLLEALEDKGFVEPVLFPIDDARSLDVLIVPSGWGDGAYVTWAGTDASGGTVAYLTSFDVLDRF